MIDTIISVLENYGVIGLLAVGMVALFIIVNKLEKRFVNHKTIQQEREKLEKDKEEEKTKTCEKHSGYFAKVFNHVDALERKDVADDGEFKSINIKLEHLEGKVDTINTGVNKIVDHFVAEGMKK